MKPLRSFVMAGLDPAIHDFSCLRVSKTWMPGSSPGMTRFVTHNPGSAVM
jgi:hypothetical protein